MARRCLFATLHRRGLQCQASPLGARIQKSCQVRRGTRPADGHLNDLTPVHPQGCTSDLRPFWTGVLRAQEFGSKQIEGIPSVAVKSELESLLNQVAGLDFGLRIHSDA